MCRYRLPPFCGLRSWRHYCSHVCVSGGPTEGGSSRAGIDLLSPQLSSHDVTVSLVDDEEQNQVGVFFLPRILFFLLLSGVPDRFVLISTDPDQCCGSGPGRIGIVLAGPESGSACGSADLDPNLYQYKKNVKN
jgi:hypothetical protein